MSKLTLNTAALAGKPVTVIALGGEIDESNLAELNSVTQPLVGNADVRLLILDFKDVTFLNSTVIGFIAELFQQLSAADQVITIIRPNKDVLDVISLVGLTEIIDVHESIEAALLANEIH